MLIETQAAIDGFDLTHARAVYLAQQLTAEGHPLGPWITELLVDLLKHESVLVEVVSGREETG